MVAGHQEKTFSADLILGGDYGTALCASVANGDTDIVESLLKKNVNLWVTGRWIKSGWQIPLTTVRPIRRCASCCCDHGGHEDG